MKTTTSERVKEFNNSLLNNIMSKEPGVIYANFELDPLDDIYSKSFSKIQNEALDKCVGEVLKTNLK